jgi:hypothetical protein
MRVSMSADTLNAVQERVSEGYTCVDVFRMLCHVRICVLIFLSSKGIHGGVHGVAEDTNTCIQKTKMDSNSTHIYTRRRIYNLDISDVYVCSEYMYEILGVCMSL